MSDTISRAAAIDYCYALINAENPSDPSDEWNYSQERINQTEVILHHLEFMPSAQPEIIRCKDCRKNPNWEWVGCPMTGKDTRKPDDFCSYAERRADE